jgi:hypothetical protein
MEITACPNCGSTNIGIGSLMDGLSSGLSAWNEVCRECGYQGRSLLFTSEVDYATFLTLLKKYKQEAEKSQQPEVKKPHREHKKTKHGFLHRIWNRK